MKNFKIPRYQMFCGSAKAEAGKYKLVNGKGLNVWVVSTNGNPDEIYVDTKDPNSQGFAGRDITFPLEAGGTYVVKGPWNSNAEQLLKETGIDLTNNHLTLVVLCKGIERNGSETVLTDVIYQDEKPAVGQFNRYKDLIKQYPEAKYYYASSNGGSSFGPVRS